MSNPPEEGRVFTLNNHHHYRKNLCHGKCRVVVWSCAVARRCAHVGSGRLYIDDGANPDQQRELAVIFSGSKGGMLEGLWGAVMKNWHPSRISKIDIQWGDNPEVRADDIGAATLKPFQDGAGKTATLTGAAAQAAFHIDSMRLASASAGSWADPNLGSWESDSATLHSFNWAA